MSARKKIVLWPFIAAIVSGVLLAMCFPGWNLSGLVWLWMLPLLPAVWRGQSKWYGFFICYLSGVTFWLINLKWLWTVSGLGALVMAAFLALYFGLWGAIAVSIGNPWRKKLSKNNDDPNEREGIREKIANKQAAAKPGANFGSAVGDSFRSLRFAFVNAAAWVGIEWLRGWLFTGFGWNGLGVAFHNTPVLAQAADLVGVTGLAFMPVLMSAVLIQTGRRLGQEAMSGKLKARLDFSVAALLLAMHFCYGVWRARDVNSWDTQRVRVLLVQENIPQNLKWDESEVVRIMDDYREGTELAIKALDDSNKNSVESANGEVELKHPDFVIWPESALPNPLLYVEGEEGYYFYGNVEHLLENEIRPLGNFTLIAGMNEFEAEHVDEMIKWKEGGGQYNSIVAVKPGQPLALSAETYRKMHLVIFGEYIPLKDDLPVLTKLFKFSSGADFAGNFSAGESIDPLTLPTAEGDVQVIPNVCFEDTVGRLTRQFVRHEPQVIVNVTNDGWFKESEAAAQHMANARFRAIELRRPMIRSANTGVSGIISAAGSLVDPATGDRQIIEDEHGNHFTRGNLYGHAYAPVDGPLTLYAVAGDWFSWLMLVSLAVAIVRRRISG
ncbi:MAG TPA: apolipoprotein N-acyltransferase [Verrucomicrobiales bacterium]|jgi:apolipoprotein N-acyltransferase|nr:apolipoprotein N-acyltransferase [Verrucomicrobiales bacterium]HCL97500.1 apolipoprotein N-acyltransferase [Verrucomicrobiales bacterium]